MNKLHLCLGLLAASGWSQTAHSDTVDRSTVTDEIEIIAVSADPIAVSGVLATAVTVSGATSSGIANFYIPYIRDGQDKPHVGQMCRVAWFWHDDFVWMTSNGTVRNIRLIDRFDCA